MIQRRLEFKKLADMVSANPVVGIIGARQVGKTTLARQFAASSIKPSYFFDLENPDDMARIAEPMLAFRDLKGIVVIDEVQHTPNLFKVLRVLADRPGNKTKFIILGSASPGLLKQSAESLAGRIAYHQLEGFHMDETGAGSENRLWLRGGFPLSYTAGTDEDSFEWRRSFVRTFLERDIPQLGFSIGAVALRRFWTMLAHYHAQIWNASEFARAFGIADTTIRKYLDILTSALVVRQLQPWHENIGKRQVKAPKVYIADTGILHVLLNLRSAADIEGHPKLGASWEGFIIGELTRRLGTPWEECHFWSTHTGAELDLLVVRGARRIGFEIKRTTTPHVTRSMRSAIESLKLDSLIIVHAGSHTFDLDDGIKAVSFSALAKEIKPL
jgi:predicted AAA+ superfamily ATPase